MEVSYTVIYLEFYLCLNMALKLSGFFVFSHITGALHAGISWLDRIPLEWLDLADLADLDEWTPKGC